MSDSAASPVNRLLAGLPQAEREGLLAISKSVRCDLGEELCGFGQRIGHAYFPLDGFISLVAPADEDARVEVGMIGAEGMFGLSLTMGVAISFQKAVVQGAGEFLRVNARALQGEMEAHPLLRQRICAYAYVVMTQLAQGAACVRFHDVRQRLARWLLMSEDRAHGRDVYLTQEFLAYMLGVRRVGVTHAASELRALGLIQYKRGRVQVLDRKRLESIACSCYRADLDTYQRVLDR
ncbi:MAG: Crp/Fnr family transcriptional regulator [Rhodanobacteraceae bacterium]